MPCDKPFPDDLAERLAVMKERHDRLNKEGFVPSFTKGEWEAMILSALQEGRISREEAHRDLERAEQADWSRAEQPPMRKSELPTVLYAVKPAGGGEPQAYYSTKEAALEAARRQRERR